MASAVSFDEPKTSLLIDETQNNRLVTDNTLRYLCNVIAEQKKVALDQIPIKGSVDNAVSSDGIYSIIHGNTGLESYISDLIKRYGIAKAIDEIRSEIYETLIGTLESSVPSSEQLIQLIEPLTPLKYPIEWLIKQYPEKSKQEITQDCTSLNHTLEETSILGIIIDLIYKIQNKQDKIEYDEVPTLGSNNLLTSDAIAKALAELEAKIPTDKTDNKY